ncbi:hypothetical protein N7447_011176, partial [Penicillium robsamsonii]
EQLEGKSGASSRVKKLVVEPWAWLAGPPHREYWSGWAFPSGEPHGLHWLWGEPGLLLLTTAKAFAKDVFINQGTKVRGSKTIRYRRSLNHKLCRLGIGRDSIMTRSAPYEKSKFLGSGGSMVARLKLKEIDGRAPQGVEPAA